MLIFLFITTVAACGTPQSIEPDLAQRRLQDQWMLAQHTVWELEWEAMPTGGPLTVETWRAEGKYRFEILESAAPDFVGKSVIFDGQRSWIQDRFTDELTELDSPRLSPVSDAFNLIDQQLLKTPTNASQTQTQLGHGPTQMITLTFEADNKLTMWLEEETRLPVRVQFVENGHSILLNARDFEPLETIQTGLFKPILR
ncbi:MAG: hypothetical protein AAF485_32190 [Chloroflexota bacterium]